MIEDYFRDSEGARKEFPVLQQIADLRATEPLIPTTLVMQELPNARETFIHRRGNFLDPGARVAAGVPAVLHPLRAFDSSEPTVPDRARGQNRLDFAKWLVDPQSPLTARVIANRCWFHFFGQGIVETEDDFGIQGTPPTHPELLDYLALEFVGSDYLTNSPGSTAAANRSHAATDWNWSMKRLHRLIVCSATYRQSSANRTELQQSDPRNRWLARQTRLRLDAEAVRDVALSGAGLLVRIVGGPSVFPPQPDGVFDFTQDPKPWKTAEGENRFRRGMYTHVWRSSPYPALVVFDAPDGNVSCTRRTRSNTPLQALTLANDTAFFECVKSLAERTWGNSTAALEDRLQQAMLVCYARPVATDELQRLDVLYQQFLAAYSQSPSLAHKVSGSAQQRDDQHASQFAAWLGVCRVLMNLDEFITRE